MARLTDEKLLLVHGMEDDQVDVGQSWTLAQALISRGILFTQMVRYISCQTPVPDLRGVTKPHHSDHLRELNIFP